MANLAAILLSSVLLLMGCSLTLPATISEHDRDLSGQFDGTWVLQTNGIMGKCRYSFTRAYLTVLDGVGKTSDGKGFISKTGDFRIEDKVFYKSDWAVRIYGGNLAEAKGRVIVDFKRFSATDCSIGLSIKKVKKD